MQNSRQGSTPKKSRKTQWAAGETNGAPRRPFMHNPADKSVGKKGKTKPDKIKDHKMHIHIPVKTILVAAQQRTPPPNNKHHQVAWPYAQPRREMEKTGETRTQCVSTRRCLFPLTQPKTTGQALTRVAGFVVRRSSDDGAPARVVCVNTGHLPAERRHR